MSQDPYPGPDTTEPAGPPVQGPGPDVEVDRLLDEGDLPGRPTTAPEGDDVDRDEEPGRERG